MDTSIDPADHLLTVARNALKRATEHQDSSALEHLVAAGWDPMMPLTDREIESSALARLLLNGQDAAARRLIDARSWSSDPTDPFSAVALGMAVCNCPSLVPVLLGHGVSPQTMNPARRDGDLGHSMLALALELAPAEGVDALLTAGTHLSDKERRSGVDPFLLAAKGRAYGKTSSAPRQEAVVGVLRKHGLTPSPKALRSALASAVKREAPLSTLRMWLDLGADINGSDPRTSLTPLHLAVVELTHDVERIQALLDAGANPTLKDRWGETPVERLRSQAASEARPADLDRVEALLNVHLERIELTQVAETASPRSTRRATASAPRL